MIERFEFENKNIITFDNEENIVSLNGKNIYRLKGTMKAMPFYNKKNTLDGIIIKARDIWNNIHFIAISSEIRKIRKSPIKCFEIIPTLEKDKSERIEKVENLKL